MSSPAISVLIPCYNQARYLAQTLESVLAQKNVNLEVIVSDDASTDGTAAIAEHFASTDPRVRFKHHTQNLGMAGNWNWGLAQARGEFIKYVFGDDYLTSPGSLEQLLAPLLADPHVTLSTSARQIVDANAKLVTTTQDFSNTCILPGSDVITRCLLENRNLIGEPSAVLFRRAAARPFDARYRQLIDLELWFHLLNQGDFAYIDRPLCAFRQHALQQTSINRPTRVGQFEGITLFAHYRPLLETYLRNGGSRHRLAIATFNTLYQARKIKNRPAWIAGDEAAVTTYFSPVSYGVYWLRHKLAKLPNNLLRAAKKRRVPKEPPPNASRAPSQPRFLIIRRRYLGDIVLLSSVFANIKRAHPNAFIAVLVEEKFTPVSQMDPSVDHVISLPTSPLKWFDFLRNLRRGHFTHVLDYDNRPRTALYGLFTGARVRITLRHGTLPRVARFYTNPLVLEHDYLDHRHIVDFYHRLLGLMDIPVVVRGVSLKPPTGAVAVIAALPKLQAIASNSPRVFIHPGSRSPHRIWPAECFAEIITRLLARGVTPILVAGPGEQTVVREIQSKLPSPALEISRPLSIPQLAALFATGNVVLCHDSGPMHLAAAVGTRVVALFSSQNVATWKPLGEGHITLQAPMPCSPCLSPGICNPTDSYFNHCVRHLSVDQVFNALIQQLDHKA